MRSRLEKKNELEKHSLRPIFVFITTVLCCVFIFSRVLFCPNFSFDLKAYTLSYYPRCFWARVANITLDKIS